VFFVNIAHKGVCDEVYKIIWFCGRFITAQKIDFLATGPVGGRRAQGLPQTRDFARTHAATGIEDPVCLLRWLGSGFGRSGK